MNYQEKIVSLGLSLPAAPAPVGSYVPVVISGTTAYLSGQVSKRADQSMVQGKVGSDLTLAQGQEAARAAALNVLSLIQNSISFERFSRIIRVVGYVQADPNFYEIPQVINGASDLFLQVLGECGRHARSSVGVASLPMNAAVELEVTIELKPLSK